MNWVPGCVGFVTRFAEKYYYWAIQVATLYHKGQFTFVVQRLSRYLRAQDITKGRIGFVEDHHLVGNFVVQLLDMSDIVTADTDDFGRGDAAADDGNGLHSCLIEWGFDDLSIA